MFNRKQNEIDRLNARCVELAEMLKKKNDELTIAKNNNYLIIKETQKTTNENNELKNKLKLINELITCNEYNNNEVLKSRIIELSDTTGNQNR